MCILNAKIHSNRCSRSWPLLPPAVGGSAVPARSQCCLTPARRRGFSRTRPISVLFAPASIAQQASNPRSLVGQALYFFFVSGVARHRRAQQATNAVVLLMLVVLVVLVVVVVCWWWCSACAEQPPQPQNYALCCCWPLACATRRHSCRTTPAKRQHAQSTQRLA